MKFLPHAQFRVKSWSSIEYPVHSMSKQIANWFLATPLFYTGWLPWVWWTQGRLNTIFYHFELHVYKKLAADYVCFAYNVQHLLCQKLSRFIMTKTKNFESASLTSKSGVCNNGFILYHDSPVCWLNTTIIEFNTKPNLFLYYCGKGEHRHYWYMTTKGKRLMHAAAHWGSMHIWNTAVVEAKVYYAAAARYIVALLMFGIDFVSSQPGTTLRKFIRFDVS